MQPANRAPAHRVLIWNPNRCDIHDVVLGSPGSPAYDVTPFVVSIGFNENIVFENNDDAIASSLQLDVVYDENAEPVQMTERVWVDGAPIRVFQGDVRIAVDDWVPIFTGVVRGVPSTEEFTRDGRQQMIRVTCVDRAEKYLNTLVTARAYDKGVDVGDAVIETAIEHMQLDRREIKIGVQGYPIGHKQSQLVDIEVLNGIAQMLFVVGKKPRFDSDGFLVAADTDLDKPPARSYDTRDFAISIVRNPLTTPANNSVRLLGLDNELTSVIEQNKRLAHGSITAGYFEDGVRDKIHFSENNGLEGGGRRARDTFLNKEKISSIGDFVGENLEWTPKLEEDGFTCFGGEISFDTGFSPLVRAVLANDWLATMIAAQILRSQASQQAAASTVFNAAATVAATEALNEAAQFVENVANALLIAQLLLMTEIGRVYWEVHGKPFANVYQQIQATSQLGGILTEDIKEIQLRNDWLFEIEYMTGIAKNLLKRELIKGWSYSIEMIDDPLVETDDVIEVDGMKFYIVSIKKKLARPGDGKMQLTAWRLA